VLAENGGKLKSNRSIQNLLDIWETNHNISYITLEIDLCQQFFKQSETQKANFMSKETRSQALCFLSAFRCFFVTLQVCVSSKFYVWAALCLCTLSSCVFMQLVQNDAPKLLFFQKC
jgi:hypothetical protein